MTMPAYRRQLHGWARLPCGIGPHLPCFKEVLEEYLARQSVEFQSHHRVEYINLFLPGETHSLLGLAIVNIEGLVV